MDRRLFIVASAGALAVQGFVRGSDAVDEAWPPLSIGADPRIELYAVILWLGAFRGFPGAPVVTDLEFAYRDVVEDRFAAFREHAAVERYATMAEAGFWLAHPPSAMLHLSVPPELAEEIPINDFTLRMAGGREALEAFLADARDFAAESEFMEWFDTQQTFYRTLAEMYRARLEWNYVRDLVAYYGESREAYNLILAPLFHPGGFGPRVRRPDGRYDAYAVVGPREVRNGAPGFGAGADSRRMLWHEFSHAHVNHLTERHIASLRGPVSVLQRDVREQVEAVVPWDVHVADWISEHVVRGVTTRLAYLKGGAEEGAVALAREERQFPYVGEVAELLESYEAARDRHPTLGSFFPQIVDLFEHLAA